MFDTSHFHPMLVHFPVAILILGFVIEIASYIHKKESWLHKTALLLMIVGTLSLVTGYLSGEFFTNELKGAAGELKEQHELFAKLSMAAMFLVTLVKLFLLWRNNENLKLKYMVTAVYGVGAVLVGYTG